MKKLILLSLIMIMGSHQAMAGNASAVFQNSGLSAPNCYLYAPGTTSTLSSANFSLPIGTGKKDLTFSKEVSVDLHATTAATITITNDQGTFAAARGWAEITPGGPTLSAEVKVGSGAYAGGETHAVPQTNGSTSVTFKKAGAAATTLASGNHASSDTMLCSNNAQ